MKSLRALLTAVTLVLIPAVVSAESVSADGRYVAFTSAGNVFLRDTEAGTTTLVSRAAGTTATTANGASMDPVISADGWAVAFKSLATNLVAGPPAPGADGLYVYDRATGTVTFMTYTPPSSVFAAAEREDTGIKVVTGTK